MEWGLGSFRGDIDMDIDVEADVDIDSYLGCFKGFQNQIRYSSVV